MTGFSVYLPFLKTHLDLTNTQLSLLNFTRSLFGVIGMLFMNKALMHFEIRRVVTASMLVAAVAFITYGLSHFFPGVLFASALAGTAYGFGSMIPVSILISRWFHTHRGLALGICMSATGVSAFVASPILTAIVERYSLKTAFWGEAVFIAAMAVVAWTLLRSKPSCLNLEPLGDESEQKTVSYAEYTAPQRLLWLMASGFLILGMAATNLPGNLSLLYQSVGYDSERIASIVSFFEISLAIGKCVSGELTDKIGPLKSCMLLFVLSVTGCTFCCFARAGGLTLAATAVILVGFGFSVASIAPSAFAARVAAEEDYPKTISRFQTCSTLGALLFAAVPGIIADRTGNYIATYILMTGTVVLAMIILQGTYHRIVCVESSSSRMSKIISLFSPSLLPERSNVLFLCVFCDNVCVIYFINERHIRCPKGDHPYEKACFSSSGFPDGSDRQYRSFCRIRHRRHVEPEERNTSGRRNRMLQRRCQFLQYGRLELHHTKRYGVLRTGILQHVS